ncbi:MAG: 23S rRNA (adenine(2503)-C(2))-methyltransferase RlmN [Deltaproteobacteria bacterium]|nr:23S rRNA (adenine(2503)-C(2))-methyltransferase RlmN [Deltaproteobacteria bacterium]
MRSATLDELREWGETRDFTPYRASQIAGWLYNRPPTEVAGMHNLPAPVREALEEDFDTSLPRRALVRESVDGTRKFLTEFADQRVVETVLIPREGRITLCISSQVGCALECSFCATARLGLTRNLEPFEIVSQVMIAREMARPELLTNYVFMGMGEPLANYDRLVRAIEILTARWGLGISPRRITVSTAGLVPQLRRLVEDTDVHVAISLASARDQVRDVLIPINRRYPLQELIDACRGLPLPRRKRITFEITLLAGINDSVPDADAIAALLRGLAVKVNLIPFNEFAGSGYRRPGDEAVNAFQERLLRHGIHTTVRISRGSDIDAACGQLAAATPAGAEPDRGGDGEPGATSPAGAGN